MIKETQIRSFINLISKIRTTQKSKKSFSILSNSRFPTEDIPKYESMVTDESVLIKHKRHQKIINKYPKIQNLNRESYSEHFLQSFKCPSKHSNKKNAFQIYRESLQKKRQYQSNLLMKKQGDTDIDDNNLFFRQKNHLKKIIFPSNRSKSYKKTKAGQDKTNKKIVHNSPFSIKTTNNHDSFIKYQKQNVTNDNLLEQLLSETERRKDKNQTQLIQKMHMQKLNYKPSFRVKKLNTQTLEQSEYQVIRKSGKSQQQTNYHRKLTQTKINKLKTQSCTIAQEKKLGPIYICKNQRHLKSKKSKRLIDVQQIQGWRHDYNQYASDNF